MTRLRYLLAGRLVQLAIRLGATFAAALAVAGPAAGATSHPELDRLASSVAGHPVAVVCETDELEWHRQLEPYGYTGAGVLGYVKPWDVSRLYLSPSRCLTLLLFLDGWGRDYPVGASLVGRALGTLVHEAVHTRGVWDEGDTDCAMLAELPAVVAGLGLPDRVKVGGYWTDPAGRRRYRWSWQPNPWQQHAVAVARADHANRGPDYRGPCDL